jgi:hypothetical protein
MVDLDLFLQRERLITQPHDPANRWPRRVPAFDDFHIQPAATRALASGR